MLKQVMLHAIKNGEKPLIASMEENVRTVFKDMARMACLTDDPSPRQIDRFVSFISGNLWLYDQQGRVSPQKLIAVTRYAIAELKVTHVMIDSLMMMAIPRDDYEAQAAFVSELHNITLHEPATIHLVAHMRKRDGKGGEEAPGSIHDVAGGQEIGSMVDSVYVVWRNMKEGARAPGEFQCALKVDKQRGRIDWLGTLGLNYHQGSRQFVEDVHPRGFGMSKAKSSKANNQEQAPECAAFVEAMREAFGKDEVKVLFVEENGFKLGESEWKPK
jgi:hypothetical protein